ATFHRQLSYSRNPSHRCRCPHEVRYEPPQLPRPYLQNHELSFTTSLLSYHCRFHHPKDDGWQCAMLSALGQLGPCYTPRYGLRMKVSQNRRSFMFNNIQPTSNSARRP